MRNQTFAAAWTELFVTTMNLLCYEPLTKDNIGRLEQSLIRFVLTSDTFHGHPFHQAIHESTSQWGARLFNEYRSTVAACVHAGFPDRRPSDAQLVSLVYGCVHPSLWLVADVIIRERNLRPTNFHDALDIMLAAERQDLHQDPQVTFTNQLRATPQPPAPSSAAVSVSSPLTAKTPLHRSDTDQVQHQSPLPVTPAASTPPPAPPPASNEDPTVAIDQNPVIQTIRQLLDAEPPLKQRQTVELHGSTYYVLPAAMPQLSKRLSQALQQVSRCSNCANGDKLFPLHTWKNCPFYTTPHRVSLWPEHHSPIPSIAEGGMPPKSLQSYSALCSSTSPTSGAPPSKLSAFHFSEPAPYRGTVTKINRGISDRDRGLEHVF